MTGTGISDRDAANLIEAVRDAARTEIMPRFRNLAPSEIDAKSDPWDLVTVADRAAEIAIGAAIAKILPGAAIVGEEAVAADPAVIERIGRDGLCAIIDPIDGTGNFAAGVAVFGVILAVAHRGECVFGLLYDPVVDDWMMARRGQGAWAASPGRAPTRLSVAPARPLGAATGLLPLDTCGAARRAGFIARFGSVAQVRNLRCSCHDYRLLASGQADFLVALQLKPWDHAAGQLILQEAGGWAQVDAAAPYSPLMREGQLVAANTAATGAAVTALLSGDPPQGWDMSDGDETGSP